MSFRRRYILPLLMLLVPLLLMVGCDYDRHEECPPLASGEEIMTSLHLSNLAPFAISGELLPEGAVFKARVVADDASGNFYRTLVVQADGVGAELRLALYDLHALYPVGCEVAVECGGLAVVRSDGALCIGRRPYDWSSGRVEPVAPRSQVLQRVRVTATIEPQEPRVCNIGELSESLCGTLVRIEGVHYEGTPASWADVGVDYSADRYFVDSQGERIEVRTSPYADFAAEPIPEGELSVQGILYKSEENYFVRLRSGDDVAR